MRKLLAVAAALSTIVLASPATAGGWAATSLDPMAAAPVAGEPTDIGFTIRQHGVTPVAVDDVAIEVTDAAGAVTRFAAVADGAVGHYVATVELPASGRYDWSVIQGWFGEQDLGVLDVAGSSAGSGDGWGTSPLTVSLAVVAAALVGAGLFDLGRTRLRRRAAA